MNNNDGIKAALIVSKWRELFGSNVLLRYNVQRQKHNIMKMKDTNTQKQQKQRATNMNERFMQHFMRESAHCNILSAYMTSALVHPYGYAYIHTLGRSTFTHVQMRFTVYRLLFTEAS